MIYRFLEEISHSKIPIYRNVCLFAALCLLLLNNILPLMFVYVNVLINVDIKYFNPSEYWQQQTKIFILFEIASDISCILHKKFVPDFFATNIFSELSY
jgi:hypothetical protein